MLKKIIIPLVLLLTVVFTANATHIMGGEVKYEYLGSNGPTGTPFRYRLTFNIYNYCGQGSQFPTGEKDMDYAVYRADDNSLIVNGNLTTSSCANITPPMPPGCVITDFQNICIRLCQFTTIVNLPLVLDGYHVSYQNCCRNDQITNLQLNGGGGGGTTDGNNYYAYIPNPIYKNNSPVFSSLPTPAFCIGDTVTINNNASDPDGDKLIFEFVTPWGGEFSPPGAWVDPPIECIYNAGYSTTQPFGAAGYANINPATGISEYYSPTGGLYVVAINVKEYRTINGVETLIGTVRRDMQLLVSGNCPANVGPTVSTLSTTNSVISTSSSVVFDIESGQKLCFRTRGTDASDSVFVSAVGNILDGSNGYTGPLATFNTTKGKPTSTSDFCWQTNCNVVGTFFVNATIADKGCPPKSENVTYQINVNKFKAPTSITGPSTLCYSATAANAVYTAVTPQSTSTYRWVVTGNGTIQGSSTNPSVTVKWNSPGAYSIKFIETSQYGCKDSISTVINVQNGAQVNAGADVNICAGTPATLDATSSSFVSYLWLPTNQSTGNITVSPTATTTYIVRGTDAATGCFSYDTVNVNVVNVDAKAGPDKSICSGTPTNIGLSTSGATFIWSPAAYINGSTTNATVQTVAYNNTSTSDTTITYYLQTTSTFLGCIDKDTVKVTFKVAPKANAGADGNICSGDTIQIGSSSDAGHTYSWTQPSGGGLTATNISNPKVIGVNTGTTPITNSYIVTATVGTCTKKDTVKITIYPSLKNIRQDTTQSICFGTTLQMGNSGDNSQTYVWNPTVGLSNGNISNPVLNYTHNPSADTTINFVATISNAFGCTKQVKQTVTIKPAPTANAGADASICSGDTTTIGSAAETNVTYTWTSTIGLLSPTSSITKSTLTNTTTAPVIRTYIVTANLNGCLDKDTVKIQVYPSLKNVSAGADRTLCFGDTVHLGTNTSDATQTYTWTPTIGLINPATSNPTFSYTHNPTIDTTIIYTVTVANAFGCNKKDEVTVLLKQSPIAGAGADMSICSGDTTTIGTAAETNVTYSWASTTGLLSPTASITDVTLTNTTTAPVNTTFIVTATLNGCIDRDTVTVQTYPSLKNVDAGADQVICFGNTVSLGNAGDASQTYVWTPTVGLVNPNTSNPTFNYTHNPTVDTTIIYTVMVANAFGCDETDVVTVVVKQTPVANAGADVDFCSGETVTIGSADAGATYTWSTTTGIASPNASSTTITLTNTTTSPVITDYYLTADINGCIDIDTISVKVYPAPTAASLIGALVVCPGIDGLQYGFTTYNANSTYQWFINGGTIASIVDDTATVNWGAPNSSAFISVFEITEYNCPSDTVKLNVRINTKLEPTTPDGLNPVCLNDAKNLLYNTSLSNGSAYTWNIDGGVINSGNGTNEINTTWSAVGTGKLWVIESVTADSVCTGQSDTLYVEIKASPMADAGADVSICSGDTANLGATTIAGQTYSWTNTSLLNSGTIANPVTTDINSGTSPVINQFVLLTSLANGCEARDTVNVEVYPSLKNVNAGTDRTICSYDTITLGTASSTGQIYTWNMLTGISDSTVAEPVFTVTNISGTNTVYTYLLQVANAFNCSKTDTVAITVKSAPIPNAGNDISICSGVTDTIGSANNSQYTYTWLNTNGLSSGTVANPTITLVNNNATTDSAIYVVNVNLNGCFDNDTVKVFIYPSLKAIEAGLDTALCAGQTVVLGPSQTISNQQYTWIPANNLSNATIANPVLDSINTGTSNIVLQYVLSVDNGFNCKANDTVNVVLKPQLRPLTLTGTMELCQFTNSQLYYVSGLDGSTYTWTLDGTAMTTSNDSIVFDWNTPGTFTLNVSELNQKCAGNAYDTLITVNPKPVTPSITGEAAICPQKADGFVYYASGLSGSNYQWNITGGTITSVGSGTDTVYVNWNNELVKSLQVTETSNKNCVSDAGVQPIIWDAANVNMLVVSNQNEEEKNVNLAWRLNDIQNYPNNVDLYRREILPTVGTWVKVATLPKTDTSYTDLGLSTDANSFEYKIVGINSCGDSLITLLHNNILLKGAGDEATETTTIDWNEYKNWSNSVKEYQVWRKLDDAAYELYQTVDKNTLSQSYTNANDGFTQCYKIFAIEEQGNNRLSISNEICLQFANPLMIPNVFTPNGDGTNDTWIIENIHLYKKSVINIYNRWGNEVKQLEAYKNDWNGDGLSEGVYYFILNLNNGQEPVKGWLQILK